MKFLLCILSTISLPALMHAQSKQISAFDIGAVVYHVDSLGQKKPASGLTIHLYRGETNLGSRITDSSGRFRFDNQNEGLATLKIKLLDKDFGEITYIQNEMNDLFEIDLSSTGISYWTGEKITHCGIPTIYFTQDRLYETRASKGTLYYGDLYNK